MKTSFPFKIIFNLILVISILIIVLAISSCKTNSGVPNYPVTEEDAAEIISNAASAQFGGLIAHINDGVLLSQKAACGIAKDTLIVHTSQSTSSPLSFKNSIQWHYQVSCTNGAPSGSYTGSINYSGPHFTADNTCSGTLTCVTAASPSNYKISLKLTIDGTDHKKAVDVNPLNTNIDIQAAEIIADKISGQVVSGQMQVNIHISYYNYWGTLKFTGNRTAVLTLNSGAVYNLSL